MSNQSKVEQLFQFTTKIRRYDRDTFQRIILEEVIKTKKFFGTAQIQKRVKKKDKVQNPEAMGAYCPTR